MKRTAARLGVWIWTLIFGGLLAGSLGYALERTGAAMGAGIVVASAIAVAVGIVLIWVRSRMPER